MSNEEQALFREILIKVISMPNTNAYSYGELLTHAAAIFTDLKTANQPKDTSDALWEVVMDYKISSS